MYSYTETRKYLAVLKKYIFFFIERIISTLNYIFSRLVMTYRFFHNVKMRVLAFVQKLNSGFSMTRPHSVGGNSALDPG